MGKKKYESLNDLLSDLRSGEISTKVFTMKIKYSETLTSEVIKNTSFLDEYNDVNINERIYYIINNINDVVRCKYCGDKATFIDITKGYRQACSKTECKFNIFSDARSGKHSIHDKRMEKYKEWEQSITSLNQLNDIVITEHMLTREMAESTTNEIILLYMNNRYKDSDSIEETWHRITKTHIEEKPKCACPGCNKPVKYRARESQMFSKYCSDRCKGIGNIYGA